MSAIRPHDQVGKARRQLCLELIDDLEHLDGKLKGTGRRIERPSPNRQQHELAEPEPLSLACDNAAARQPAFGWKCQRHPQADRATGSAASSPDSPN